MADGRPVVLAVGEVLWDLLPGGRQLGGAPANFAYHAAQLGAEARIVSAVGEDELGREVLERLGGLGLDTSLIAVVPGRPTGTVTVELEAGQPRYTIHEGVAWDFVPATGPVMEAAGRADCVCFGTLAQRGEVSRGTVRAVLGRVRRDALRVFDVNFRQHYYTREVVEESLRAATVLKINEEEWPRLVRMPGLGEGLFEQFSELRLIAVTRGAKGSVLRERDGRVVEHPGFTAEPFVDAVGAGDAFTAALAVGLLRGVSLERISENANRLAAHVCTRAGATPEIPAEVARAVGGDASFGGASSR